MKSTRCIMNKIKRFEDLDVWQKARELCKDIYPIITRFPFNRDFALRDQVNKSSGSIMDNIAEGFDRDGTREFLNFLSISKASASELKSQLYRAADRNHITAEELETYLTKIEVIGKSIGGFMKYLRTCEMRGNKFK